MRERSGSGGGGSSQRGCQSENQFTSRYKHPNDQRVDLPPPTPGGGGVWLSQPLRRWSLSLPLGASLSPPPAPHLPLPLSPPLSCAAWQAQLEALDRVELDFALRCPSGNRDRACSVWDRIVSVSAACAGRPAVEVGRWVNAFQRRGRWLTPTPLLHGLGGQTCVFTFAVPDPWRATLSLRFAATAPAAAERRTVERVAYPNPSDQFTSRAYNANRTVAFTPPPGTRRVEVAALITGHGGCEFQATSHHFVVNNRTTGGGGGYSTLQRPYADRYMLAGPPSARLPDPSGPSPHPSSAVCEGIGRVVEEVRSV